MPMTLQRLLEALARVQLHEETKAAFPLVSFQANVH